MLHPEILRGPAFALKAHTALRSSHAEYRSFVEHEKLSREDLLALQTRRATRHAQFAMQHSPYYRDLYTQAGFSVADLNDPAAFEELPIIDKADVRANFDRFCSDEATAHNTSLSVTGGSTGEPLRLLRDVRVPSRALEWRLFRWWGIDPSVDIAMVQRHTKSGRQALKHRAMWWPSQRLQLDAFRMTAEAIDAFIADWHLIRPKLLIGYAGGIAELANVLDRRGLKLNPPVAIAVTAAPITDSQRASIQSAFNAPVYDHYRSSEVPWIAGECAERSGLHVFADVRKVEVLDAQDRPAQDGSQGQVVVSDLSNRVFPIIRYRLGDRTSVLSGSCSCGSSLPRIAPVLGRVSDAFHLPSGQIVAGEGLAQIFSKNPEAVRQFQVHQLPNRSVVLRCVPSGAAGDRDVIERVTENLRSLVNHEVPVTVDLVEEIPHRGGKFQCIVSDAS